MSAGIAVRGRYRKLGNLRDCPFLIIFPDEAAIQKFLADNDAYETERPVFPGAPGVDYAYLLGAQAK